MSIPEFEIDPITNSQRFDDYFLSLIKPWSNEDIERFYIYSPNKPPLTSVAALSGLSLSSIKRLYKDNDFSTKRKEYWIEQKLDVNYKTIEKLGDIISEQNKDLLLDHFNAYKMVRETSFLRLKIYYDDVKLVEQKVNEGKATPEQLTKVLKSESARDLHFLAQALDISVKGERLATGIDFWQSEDAAYKALQDKYLIVDKRDVEKEIPVLDAAIED